MVREIELSTLDLRYESYRVRNAAVEARLLASIAERGIEEPLEGVDAPEQIILLNGFKRYRCAEKLGMGTVPYVSLADDEVTAILSLIRASSKKPLEILEQARFIDDLAHRHNMDIAQIAETLSRSKSWVTMRLGLIGEISDGVREKIFRGAVPVYAYMYTLRHLMRMNGVKKREIEEFVSAVSGKKLSMRDIEYLAHGYFRGPSWFREEVQKGHLTLALEQMKEVPDAPDGCNEFERVFLKDLETAGKYMQRVTAKSQAPRLKTRAFLAEANLLTAGILSRVGAFTRALRGIHDRSGKTSGHIPATQGGNEHTGAFPSSEGPPKDDSRDHQGEGRHAEDDSHGQDRD
jgi:ParB/RepB/Spo0J family partition protein